MDSYQYHILHAQMYLEQRKVYVDQSHLHSYHKSLINILEQLVRFLPSIYIYSVQILGRNWSNKEISNP